MSRNLVSANGSGWKPFSTVPGRRRGYATAVMNIDNDDDARAKRIVFVGGVEETTVDTVQIFNVGTGSWETDEDGTTTTYRLKERRYGCCAVTMDEKLFVFGGHNPEGRHLRSCEVHDLSISPRSSSSSSSSMFMPPMRERRLHCAAVVLQNRYVAVLGGHNGSSTLSSVEIFDTHTFKWCTGTATRSCFPPNMIEARCFDGCGSVVASSSGRWVVVFDAEDDRTTGEYIDMNEVMDTGVASWQHIPTIGRDTCVEFCDALTLQGYKEETKLVVLVVGRNAAAELFLQSYDSGSRSWGRVPSPLPTHSIKRNCGWLRLDHQLLIAGYDGSNGATTHRTREHSLLAIDLTFQVSKIFHGVKELILMKGSL